MTALIFAIDRYEHLAEELCHLGRFEPGPIERNRFPDGEHYLRLENDVNDRDAVLVG
jgi:phosphoribosylpyrophosphate synthetase